MKHGITDYKSVLIGTALLVGVSSALATDEIIDGNLTVNFDQIVKGSIQVGPSTVATGANSMAQGSGSKATGTASHAMGLGAAAFGIGAHAEGVNTKAYGDVSHAEGSGTVSSNQASHAEGYATKALGNYSHAEGFFTLASGTAAHAEGNGTLASGDYSYAGGSASEATAMLSHAIGSKAMADHENSFVWSSSNADNTFEFVSTANHQFSVYADNGIRFETGPNAGLTVNGVEVGAPRNIEKVLTTTQVSVPLPASWTDIPGLSVTIQSSSTTSDFIVKGSVLGYSENGGTTFRLVQNGVPVGMIGSMLGVYGNGALAYLETIHYDLIVSPEIQGAITYKVQCSGVNASFDFRLNEKYNDSGEYISTIISEEIKN